MKIERLSRIIKILIFIKENLDCVVPNIRDFFNITPSDPPSQNQKELYKILSYLERIGYIEKSYFKKRDKWGAHFSLRITQLGLDFLGQLGIIWNHFDPLKKVKIIEKLGASIRLIIRRNLAGKLSKPLAVEITPELSDAIIEEINSNFENITLIDLK